MSWLKPLPQSWWRTASTRHPAPKNHFTGTLRAAALQCWEAENTASALAPTPSIRPPKCCASASPEATAQSRLGSWDSRFPEVVRAAAADPDCPWVAHGAAFERAMLEAILAPQHHWPVVPVERHVCTMSLALAHSYPGSLEGLAKILGLVNQKDVAREKIIRVMWKPRKPRPGEDPTQIYWVDTPELRVDLYIYNRQDVAVEREGHQHPKLDGPAGIGARYVGARC